MRAVLVAGLGFTLAACNALTPSPEEKVGLLRELVRARTVSRDTLPIDGCSLNRFMDGLSTWRDSLDASERAAIIEDATCEGDPQPVAGRFVLLRWHRAWSGEYVMEGSTAPWEFAYRFTDGVFVGRAPLNDGEFYAGIKAPPAPHVAADSVAARGDSSRSAGSIADTVTDSTHRDSASVPLTQPVRPSR